MKGINMNIVKTLRLEKSLLDKVTRICDLKKVTFQQVVIDALEMYVDSIAVPSGTAMDAAEPHPSRSNDLTARMDKSIGRGSQCRLYPRDALGKQFLALAGKKRFASQEDADMWQYIVDVFGDDLTFTELRKQFRYWRNEKHVPKYVAVKCVLRRIYKMAQEEEAAGDRPLSMMSEEEQSLVQVKEMYRRLGFDVENMELCWREESDAAE